ncbi:proteasome assembly chaperone family protein [Pseudactinotalea sp. Z1739]|uniref:proteasome assembly chaperone family protein n=1 Tax=Pseudactinotalea sp. Z1739 TaxID=3413028 RepID=UPI003C7DD222
MAADPRDLYTRETEVTDLPEGEVAVLVHALQGSIDAGHAGALLAEHLTAKLSTRRVATFDVDALLDYRSRRPVMTYEDGAWTTYDEPVLTLDLLRDDEGQAMLLLHGLEPDLKWELFIDAITGLIEEFGVRTTVGVHGIPMGVPHTRPITVTAHGTRPELVADYPNYISSVRVPGSASALLEFRLGGRGHDALGFAAHVPHYLAQSDYPQAAAELVRQITRVTGLGLPIGDLEADGVRIQTEIDRQVGASDEVGAVVRALEEQFDSFAEATGDEALGTPVVEAEEVPSADEIAARFSQYLAGQDNDKG